MIEYRPPAAADLQQLKEQLGFSAQQMAELASVASGAQWRKYTNGTVPRQMNLHMLFFIAARLELPAETLAAVVQRMRNLGAQIDVHAVSPQTLSTAC